MSHMLNPHKRQRLVGDVDYIPGYAEGRRVSANRFNVVLEAAAELFAHLRDLDSDAAETYRGQFSADVEAAVASRDEVHSSSDNGGAESDDYTGSGDEVAESDEDAERDEDADSDAGDETGDGPPLSPGLGEVFSELGAGETADGVEFGPGTDLGSSSSGDEDDWGYFTSGGSDDGSSAADESDSGEGSSRSDESDPDESDLDEAE